MVRRLGLSLGLAIAMCGSTAQAGESTDEVLKRLFPDRDLSKKVIKIVNIADRYYAVADSIEIMANGNVQFTNGAVIRNIGQAGEPPRYFLVEGARMVVKFRKPVKRLGDLAGNAFVGVE
jgi:hypothetical protein